VRRTVRRAAIALLAVVLLVSCSREAAAQSVLESGWLEVSAGAAWVGSQAFDSASATETTPSGSSFSLFNTSSELGGAAGFDARVGVRIAGTLVVEADATFARPELRVTIANDVENAPSTTAVERLQQYMIGGGATWYVPRRNRIVPFVAGGGGYLRQLHDRALLVETGTYYQVGGGVLYLLTSQPGNRLKATGIRADVRAVILNDGVALDDGRHTAPAVAGSFFVRF
jgi:hypothetical protein